MIQNEIAKQNEKIVQPNLESVNYCLHDFDLQNMRSPDLQSNLKTSKSKRKEIVMSMQMPAHERIARPNKEIIFSYDAI